MMSCALAATVLPASAADALAQPSSLSARGARVAAGLGVQITLDPPSPPTVWEDDPTHLTGQLSNGRSDKLIRVRAEIDGSWSRIGTTRTGSDGSFALDYTPADPGTVTLEAVHPVGHGKVRSDPQTLTVLDRRVFLVTRPSYPTFSDIVLTGTTRPRLEGQHVVIQHLVQGRWVPGASGDTDADGRYAITMRNNLPGPWTVRAWWGGSNPSGGTLEVSLAHHYRVNALLAPVVTHVTRAQLGGSYHTGCPVGPALLRNVGVTFKTFGPLVHRGILVVRTTIVGRVIGTLREALVHAYPIRRMFTAAHYGGSDIAAMNHDDTSAFNCRHVTGDPTQMSPHSYGIAIDINTVENPYQDIHGTWWPKHVGFRFRHRAIHRPGMLYDGSIVTKAWKSRGFEWGGDWYHPDYQHFDTVGQGLRGRAARVAGPLSARSMPPASAFGPGWRRYDDPGGPEAGWYGNGTFAHARRGPEASKGVLPLGCAAPPPTLPSARFALQGAYRSARGAPGQAVVLRFSTPHVAESFFAGLQAALLGCTTPDGPNGLQIQARSATATTYAGERVYAGHEDWAEHDSRAGADVTVMLQRG